MVAVVVEPLVLVHTLAQLAVQVVVLVQVVLLYRVVLLIKVILAELQVMEMLAVPHKVVAEFLTLEAVEEPVVQVNKVQQMLVVLVELV
jgi:hypothetical protein